MIECRTTGALCSSRTTMTNRHLGAIYAISPFMHSPNVPDGFSSWMQVPPSARVCESRHDEEAILDIPESSSLRA